MKINTKIFNKIPENQIQQDIEMILHHEQVRFIPGCTDGSTHKN